jgi:hypothetical protein
MATGFIASGGSDFDSLFMARVNAKRADVGFLKDGVDISNRYEPIGAGTKIADVGYQKDGVDISNYFRNISQPLGNSYSLVAGQGTTGGFATIGFSRTFHGSISPTTYPPYTINKIIDWGFSGYFFHFELNTLGVASNYFTSIVCNGVTYNSSAAEYFSSSGVTVWRWRTQYSGMVNGGTYPVTITPAR